MLNQQALLRLAFEDCAGEVEVLVRLQENPEAEVAVGLEFADALRTLPSEQGQSAEHHVIHDGVAQTLPVLVGHLEPLGCDGAREGEAR